MRVQPCLISLLCEWWLWKEPECGLDVSNSILFLSSEETYTIYSAKLLLCSSNITCGMQDRFLKSINENQSGILRCSILSCLLYWTMLLSDMFNWTCKLSKASLLTWCISTYAQLTYLNWWSKMWDIIMAEKIPLSHRKLCVFRC